MILYCTVRGSELKCALSGRFIHPKLVMVRDPADVKGPSYVRILRPCIAHPMHPSRCNHDQFNEPIDSNDVGGRSLPQYSLDPQTPRGGIHSTSLLERL